MTDMANWITNIQPSAGSGNATVTVSLQNNSGAQRAATVRVKGQGVPDKTFTLTQNAVTLTGIQILGRGSVVGEVQGAESAWDAISNTSSYSVFTTSTQLGPGVRMFLDAGALQPANGNLEWFRLGDNVFQLDTEGWVLGVIPVDDVEDPDPDPGPTNGITPPALLFPAEGGIENIQITALNNAAWSASTDGLGVLLNDSIGVINGNGNSLITVSVPANPFDQLIMFVVTVNISGSLYNCSCTQAPAQN